MAARSSRSRRRWLVAGAVVLALVLGVGVGLPRWLAGQVESSASEALGRRVSLGSLDLSWLRGSVALEDLEVGGPLDAEPLPPERGPVRLGRLTADLDWGGLLRGEIRLSEIALDAPVLRFERDAEGAIAPLVLAAPSEEPPEEETADEEGAGWPIRVDSFALRDLDLFLVDLADSGDAGESYVELTLDTLRVDALALVDGSVSVGTVALVAPGLSVDRDRARAPAPAAGDVAARPPSEAPPAPAAPEGGDVDPFAGLRLDTFDMRDAELTLRWEGGEPLPVKLDLSAQGISAERDARFPLELTLQVEDGQLSLAGELGLQPVRFDGDLRWEGLSLPRLLAASGAGAGVEITSGLSDGELAVALALDGAGDAPAGARIAGRVDATSLDAALPGLELAWERLSVAVDAATLPLAGEDPPQIALARVELQEPRVDYLREASAGTPDAPPSAGEGADAAGSESRAPHVSLAELRVEGGDVHVRDRTTPEPFETRLSDVSIEGRGLRWPEQDAESLKLRARNARGGKIAVDASLAGGHGKIETRVDRLALAPFDPYARQYSGLSIGKGATSVRSLVELGDRSLRTDTTVDLHDLSVREEEAGWFRRLFGMPLDVALALLRDMRGDIRVPVTAEISQDRTDVGLAGLVASTLRQAITGALTSPLKLLGGVASGAGGLLGSGLEPLDAVPGEPALAPDAEQRLTRLATILEEKPELKLVLRGRAGAADDAGIARARLVAQAAADQPVDGEDGLGFFERRRVRGALASLAGGEAPTESAGADLDPETRAAIERLVAAAQVTPAEREALARARAERARQRLVGGLGVAEEAVEIAQGGPGEPVVSLELAARGDVATAEPAR